MPGLPRYFEASMAALLLLIASPASLLAALLIRMTSPGPILFRQSRVGQSGRAFTLYKLRTMSVSRDEDLQVTAANDSRVTWIGRILRKTKIDELPELWNVLKGDLSLVGPRPEVPRYVNLTNPQWNRVLQARPGITDPVTLKLRNEEDLLAQIEGDREEYYLKVLQPYKLRGYVDYLNNRSSWTDIKVLLQTSIAILFPHTAPLPRSAEIEQSHEPRTHFSESRRPSNTTPEMAVKK
jgi:lipopolysaccharide/colanic/teichoic acid biosynthesis glycosyltransferase